MALVRVDNQDGKAPVFGNINQASEILEETRDEIRADIKAGDISIVRLGGCRMINLD